MVEIAAVDDGGSGVLKGDCSFDVDVSTVVNDVGAFVGVEFAGVVEFGVNFENTIIVVVIYEMFLVRCVI